MNYKLPTKNYKLYIDTSDQIKVKVILYFESEIVSEKIEIRRHSSQNLLRLIVELLKEKNISINQLSEIEINIGPGSYTGLRVGAAVANAIAWFLKIPVNGVKNKMVVPVLD